MNLAHITSLAAFNALVQIEHWRADSLGNTHKYLGELYDEMIELTDKFAEVALGKAGTRDIPDDESISLKRRPISDLLAECFATLTSIRAELTTGPDDDLLNIVAEMSTALNHAKYFLCL